MPVPMYRPVVVPLPFHSIFQVTEGVKKGVDIYHVCPVLAAEVKSKLR